MHRPGHHDHQYAESYHDEDTVKTGFIGLGGMGLPMAQRLQSQNHDLTLYARRPDSLKPFAGTSATIAATPAAMGASVDAVGAASYAKLINNTMFSAQIALVDDAMKAGESLGVDPVGLAAVLTTSSAACVASGVRLRAGSLAGLVDSPANLTLTKDVTLMAELLGDAPGSGLVEVAQRFVAAMRSS